MRVPLCLWPLLEWPPQLAYACLVFLSLSFALCGPASRPPTSVPCRPPVRLLALCLARANNIQLVVVAAKGAKKEKNTEAKNRQQQKNHHHHYQLLRRNGRHQRVRTTGSVGCCRCSNACSFSYPLLLFNFVDHDDSDDERNQVERKREREIH